MAFSWQICLAMLPFFPLLIIGFIARAKATMSAKTLGKEDDEEEAEEIAVGTIENMKNITTLALVSHGETYLGLLDIGYIS